MKAITLLFLLFGLYGCVSTYEKPNNLIVSGFDVPPDQILLAVRVHKSNYTGHYPVSNCKSEECIPVSFWYIHEAEVINVIKGKYDSHQITFANLQHADYIDAIKNEWYIQLKEIPSKELREQLNAKYYVVRHDSEFQRNH